MQDILNNSPYGSQYMLGDDRYNPTQSNVLGQPLSPTPTAAGLPAVDPVHDTRTPQDIKQQATQANLDTLAAQDTKDKIVNPSTGYIFNTAPTDRKNQLITGILAYGTSYLAGENEGVALSRAGQAVNSQIAMNKRQALIPGLIQKGYADVDIQKYLETGDPKDLLTNKGKVNIVGDRSVNELTGETKDLGMTPQQQADQQLSQAKISEDIRHNRASEGYEGARLGMEQQRINLEKQQYDAVAAQRKEKEEATKEATNTQTQAVAVQGNQMLAIGNDIQNDPNFEHSGTNWKTQIYRAGSSAVGDNIAGGMQSKQDQYNHMGSVIGNAGLYLDAGNKRIFAKEMEMSGKTFQKIDYKTMTKDQIDDAIENNKPIVARFTQLAEASAGGKPHPNANQVDYGNTFGSNQQLPRVGQPTAPAGGKDFSGMW
ncbi:hypothetical protein EVI96_17635 [Salmonella enterica subsp. enterica serovar Kisangani]|nr:hypothetical protein [Salmonella enterica subsp. enterica serovar Kisangani]ECG6701256.1 hypothetical protein [Salmonella enterica subsp. enterica serovar Kisangani]EDS6602756.1 hypothetical protein [Salmonella enterica subsp. enterica serovar Kisangani]